MIEVLRLLLAAVFAVAGVAKLADLRGAAQAAQSFGAPRRAAVPIALLVALAEIGIALALIPGVTARFAAAAAAALVAIFTAAIAISLVRGRTPDCHCFGQLHSAPAGPATLARNAALAGVAVLVALQPAADPTWLELAAAGVAIVVIAQGLLSFTLLRRYGKTLQRIEELEVADGQHARLAIGAEAPAFALPGLDGDEITLAGLLARARPLLLVFTDLNCGSCHELMPTIAQWGQVLADQLTIAVVATGVADERDLFARHADFLEFVVPGDAELADLYGVVATPSAVLVGSEGRIVGGPAAGAAAIAELIDTVESPPDDISNERERGNAPHIAGAVPLVATGTLIAAVADAPASTAGATQDPSASDLQSIHATLRAAGPRLVAASRRSAEAVVGLSPLRPDSTLRKRRAAAARAFELERKEILRLSSALESLQITTRNANNARASALIGLSRFALSLQKRTRALSAKPAAAARLHAEGDRLYRGGLDSIAASAQILGRG